MNEANDELDTMEDDNERLEAKFTILSDMVRLYLSKRRYDYQRESNGPKKSITHRLNFMS